jgi:hypothetical protein
MVFNKLFNRKKKEEPQPFNRTVRDLDQGYIFEYDLKTWEVKAVYEYDWGHENFSKEYKVSDGENTYYLAVEEDDDLEIVLSEKVKLRKLPIDFKTDSDGRFTAPKEVAYNSRMYYLEEESAGYFKDAKEEDIDENWEEFVSWSYYDDAEEFCLDLEQWGENSFEASHGKVLKEFEISNILPRTQA